MGRRRWVRLSSEIRSKVIRLAAKGCSYREIIDQLDISMGSVGNVLRPLGGVYGDALVEPNGVRLNIEQRVEILIGLELGMSMTAIANELSRAPSTVSREVKLSGGIDHYKPFAAQRRATSLARRPKVSKLECQRLRDRVEVDLKQLWSPQQITQRLRNDFPDDDTMWISHETIYKSLYIQGRGELRRELTQCLRTGRAKRRAHGSSEKRNRITGMINISQRPAEVADRAVPGHWEGDLIIGKDGQSAVATLVERTTRYVLLAKLDDRRAETVCAALIGQIGHLPEHLWRSLTWDQGIEMAAHQKFTELTGISVYFCDPHSPWQRGSNENTNGLLRQYMPKGTDLSVHTQADLDRIAVSLNGRPRETLNWDTPAEALNTLLAPTT